MLNRKLLLIYILLGFTLFAFTCKTSKSLPVKVFILGGQSNMDGTGLAKDLPLKFKTHPEQVTTWDNKKEKWVPLGTDSFAERRKYKFGPEIAFSHLLAEEFPKHRIAIIKTSGGGTTLWKHWLPEKPMHTRFLRNIENALQDLKNEGIKYEICGMLWMQGESDAETLESANAYENNLKLLYSDIRKQTKKPKLPIVMGRISSSLLRKTPWNFDHTKVVQDAQDIVASLDENVFIINTNALPTLKDNTHFNSEANIWLGSKMAELMIKAIE